MKNRIYIQPDQPITVKLVDPAADGQKFDFELNAGIYRLTDGSELWLPRPAVVKLNELDPRPGEEIGISRTPREKQPDEWLVWLCPSAERARGSEETAPESTEAPRDEDVPPRRSNVRQMPASKQGRLFDKGTGTYGRVPVPRPVAAVKTPYGDVLRHIIRTVKASLDAEGVRTIGDGPLQDLISTIYIDAARRHGVAYDFSEEE